MQTANQHIPNSKLSLSATDDAWRLFMLRREDLNFESAKRVIHARDYHTCQFCGFSSKQDMEVINLDGDYYNNRRQNLATACLFCAQCGFLESIGKGGFGGGYLIYLPEITQEALNMLCHVLMSSIVIEDGQGSQSLAIYRNLKLRVREVEKVLGEGFSNARLMGELLIYAGKRHVVELGIHIEDQIRLLPDMAVCESPVNQIMEGLNDWLFEI